MFVVEITAPFNPGSGAAVCAGSNLAKLQSVSISKSDIAVNEEIDAS